MSESILQAGIQGIQGGLDQFGRAANSVATAATNDNPSSNRTADLARDVVEVKQAQRTIEASAAVIKVADETLGSLLNELA